MSDEHSNINDKTRNNTHNKSFIKRMSEKVPPHPLLNNFHTIKWLRKRINNKTVERSVNTLLPKDGAPILKDTSDKSEINKRKFDKWFSDYLKPNDKFEKIKLKPKFLFSKLTLNKVLKLRDIFLEFDGDGSRKLEIDEIVEMFNKNKIEVVEEELLQLFFKDKNVRPEDAYLDFYQFMQFALSKEADQHYRNFMRKVKIRLLKKKEEEMNKKKEIMKIKHESEIERKRNDGSSFNIENPKKNEDEEEEENIFLPMNFNLVLDYFNNKGKDRSKINKIQKAIKLIDEYMREDNPDKGEKEEHEADDIQENEEEEEEEGEQSEEDPEEVEKNGGIFMNKIMDMFGELLRPKRAIDNSTNVVKKLMNGGNSAEYIYNKFSKSKDFSKLNSSGLLNLNISLFPNNQQNGKIIPSQITTIVKTTENNQDFFDEKEKHDSINYLFPESNKNYFTDFLKCKIKNDKIDSLGKNFYKKYKSLLLAAEMVKETVTTTKHPSIHENITQCNSGFKNSYYSNFYNTKTTKLMTDRERSINNTIFNNTNAQKFFRPATNTLYDKRTLPEIRRKYDKKILEKEKLNLTKNENFLNSIQTNRKDTSKNTKTFTNLKPKVKSNDSIPIKILKNIYTGPSTERSDNNRTSFCTNYNNNNIIDTWSKFKSTISSVKTSSKN